MGDLVPCGVISALGLQLLQLTPYLKQSNIFVQAVIFPQNLPVLVKGFMGNQLCLVFSDPERLLYIHTLSNKYGNADGLGHGGDKQKWWETEIPKSSSPGSRFVKIAFLVFRMFLRQSSKEPWTSEWIYGLICFPYIISVQLFFPLWKCVTAFCWSWVSCWNNLALAMFSYIPFHYLLFFFLDFSCPFLTHLVHFQGILFIFPAICF